MDRVAWETVSLLSAISVWDEPLLNQSEIEFGQQAAQKDQKCYCKPSRVTTAKGSPIAPRGRVEIVCTGRDRTWTIRGEPRQARDRRHRKRGRFVSPSEWRPTAIGRNANPTGVGTITTRRCSWGVYATVLVCLTHPCFLSPSRGPGISVRRYQRAVGRFRNPLVRR